MKDEKRCCRCEATTQILTLRDGTKFEVGIGQDPDTGLWFCNACYAKDGAEERRAEMVRQYKARTQDT